MSKSTTIASYNIVIERKTTTQGLYKKYRGVFVFKKYRLITLVSDRDIFIYFLKEIKVSLGCGLWIIYFLLI